MTPRSLCAVLRTLTDTGPPVSDAELLRRFQANDERAFAELVKRYGRLVWTVCRSLTRSEADADDAFQATFLVLVENAKKVRDAGKLSAWLHGVAYKVCAKARRSAERRSSRERVVAPREGTGSAVPDSAWDRALAAVHEEVAKLPEPLRVPFVLCCLEGTGVTEAAERLGWKLGTLSGRLTRAKDAVLARLDERGLALGVVAAVGGGAVPAAVAAKAEALARVGFTVPGSIRQLSQGVIGMSMTSAKILVAAVVVACGLGLGAGNGWVGRAEAQPPGVIEEQQRMLEELQQREAVYRKYGANQRFEAEKKADPDTFKTAKNEYTLVTVSELPPAKFRALLEEREKSGWEYCGTTPLSQPERLVWVFRRPVKQATATFSSRDVPNVTNWPADPAKPYTPSNQGPKDVTNWPTAPAKPYPPSNLGTKSKDAKAIEDAIARLTAELAEIKKAESAKPLEVKFDKTSSPLDPGVLASVLADLGQKKFGRGGKFNVANVNGVVTVFGDKDVIDWATGVVKALAK